MSDELTPVEKLTALGLKIPKSLENPLREEFDDLADAVDNLQDDYTTFKDDVNNSLTSYSEFENYLINELGLTQAQAERLRKKFESKFSNFSDFQNEVSNYSTFEEFRNSFSFGDTINGPTTEDGELSNTGIRFFSEAGVTRDNVQVPAGTVEVFGPEIHFSQTAAAADENPDKSAVISYSNFSVSDTTPVIGTLVTISVDCTNTGSVIEGVTPALIVGGEKVETGTTAAISPGNTVTFSFDYRYQELGSFETRINKSSTTTVTPVPEGLL